jgi:hypothetical protein
MFSVKFRACFHFKYLVFVHLLSISVQEFKASREERHFMLRTNKITYDVSAFFMLDVISRPIQMLDSAREKKSR